MKTIFEIENSKAVEITDSVQSETLLALEIPKDIEQPSSNVIEGFTNGFEGNDNLI